MDAQPGPSTDAVDASGAGVPYCTAQRWRFGLRRYPRWWLTVALMAGLVAMLVAGWWEILLIGYLVVLILLVLALVLMELAVSGWRRAVALLVLSIASLFIARDVGTRLFEFRLARCVPYYSAYLDADSTKPEAPLGCFAVATRSDNPEDEIDLIWTTSGRRIWVVRSRRDFGEAGRSGDTVCLRRLEGLWYIGWPCHQ